MGGQNEWEQESEAYPLYRPCPSSPGPGPSPEKVTHPPPQLKDQRQSALEGRAADHSSQEDRMILCQGRLCTPCPLVPSCASCSFLVRPLSPAGLSLQDHEHPPSTQSRDVIHTQGSYVCKHNHRPSHGHWHLRTGSQADSDTALTLILTSTIRSWA